MSAAVVIDLGEDWSVAGDLPARRRRPPARGPLAALLTVAVLLLVGGSVAPRPPFVELATIPIQGVATSQVGGDAIFVASVATENRIVSRYPMDGGERTWATPVPGPAESMTYVPGPRVLVVLAYDNENNTSRFTVLDAVNGRTLWRGDGSLVPDQSVTQAGRPGAGALMISQDPSASMLRYVDLRSGRTIWSRPFAAQTDLVSIDTTRAHAGGILLAGADGMITLVARETGEVLATRQIGRLVPLDSTDYDPEHNVIVNAVGDQLVVARQEGALRATISSYDLPGLTPRWSRTDTLAGYPYGCGPLLCLLGSQGELTALDPATGATRWTAPGWQSAENLGGGRLLGYRSGGGQHTGILDAATGRLRNDIDARWTPMADSVYGEPFKLFSAPDPGNYRYTWFGVLDPHATAVRPLTRLPGVGTQGCDLHGDLLVCRTLDAKLRVWRYQP